MTTVAGVRVLPEALAVTWERLHRRMAALPPEPAARTGRGNALRAGVS